MFQFQSSIYLYFCSRHIFWCELSGKFQTSTTQVSTKIAVSPWSEMMRNAPLKGRPSSMPFHQKHPGNIANYHSLHVTRHHASDVFFLSQRNAHDVFFLKWSEWFFNDVLGWSFFILPFVWKINASKVYVRFNVSADKFGVDGGFKECPCRF